VIDRSSVPVDVPGTPLGAGDDELVGTALTGFPTGNQSPTLFVVTGYNSIGGT
jgi:hypothetical protein